MTATVLHGLSESREGRSAFGADILVILVCLSHWSWWESIFLNVIQRQRGWTHQQGGAKRTVAKIPCSNLNPYISILHCLSPFMQTKTILILNRARSDFQVWWENAIHPGVLSCANHNHDILTYPSAKQTHKTWHGCIQDAGDKIKDLKLHVYKGISMEWLPFSWKQTFANRFW